MSRKSARENAFRLVYEFVETGERNDFTRELLSVNETEEDVLFTSEIYDTVIAEYEFLKSVISRFSHDFAFDRIYKTDLSALLISASELLFRDDVPEKVSVHEAVELSRKYSTDKSTAFINGILASVISHKSELKEEHDSEREDN